MKAFAYLGRHLEKVTEILKGVVPQELSFEDEDDFLDWTKEHLPLVKWESPSYFPGTLSLFFLCRLPASYQFEDFLSDVCRHWLLPERRLKVQSFQQRSFYLEKNTNKCFLLVEVHLVVERLSDFEKIQQRLPLLRRKLTQSVTSSKQSTLMLPVNEEDHFHKSITAIIQKWPENFENDLLNDTQCFLALSEREFRRHRSLRHQLRLVCSLYLMRKNLLRQLRIFPTDLHLDVRLLPTNLQFPHGQKPVLGLVMTIHLSSPYESFEKRHILLAVQKIFPWVQAVKESFLIIQKALNPFRLLYLEVEKPNGRHFSLDEMRELKLNLKAELKKHVEVLSPSVFDLQNAEEILRNILVLSKEVHSTMDLPQVMISFDGSSMLNLSFRVIVVRILDKVSRSVNECFKELDEQFEYIPERVSTVGHIDHYAKEASVFRLQIAKHPSLLRSNSSLNIYQARKNVLSLVTKALGEVRDYNGGFFSKQSELLLQLKGLFAEVAEKDPELIEDFFHSLHPIEMQVLIPLSSLTKLFELFLEAVSAKLLTEESCVLKHLAEKPFLFAVVYCRDAGFKERFFNELEKRGLCTELNAWTCVKTQLGTAIGCLHQSFSAEQQGVFLQAIEEILETWAEERKNVQILRLSLNHLLVSLDPRQGGDEISGILLRGLFEGLMRVDKEGNLCFAVAESFDLSEDNKRYTFKLRECFWNNGDRITAHDFCYAWKKTLLPNFATPFAYLLNIIKNAKQIKKGNLPLETIGVYALDDQCLVVELEHPCHCFLELTTHPLYFPVNYKIDQMHPNWSLQVEQAYVCNGPFQLKTRDSQETYELEKNIRYWDAKNVQLDRILISRCNSHKAMALFKKNEIDWIGHPLKFSESSFSQSEEKVEKLPLNTISWCLLNTQTLPFQSAKIRQALNLAIDRQKIAELVSLEGDPAFTPLPLAHTEWDGTCVKMSSDEILALFEEGLNELGIRRHHLPLLTFIHANNAQRKEIALAIAQQWEQTLGIHVQLEAYHFQDLFKKLTKGEYQIGMMAWKPLINDPLYTLNIFKSSTEEINLSKWENSEYQRLLDLADREVDIESRKKLQKLAEGILVKEVPFISLFHEKTANFIRKNPMVEFERSFMGNVDFKYVKVKKTTK